LPPTSEKKLIKIAITLIIIIIIIIIIINVIKKEAEKILKYKDLTI